MGDSTCMDEGGVSGGGEDVAWCNVANGGGGVGEGSGAGEGGHAR